MSSMEKTEYACTRYFATGFNVTKQSVDSLEFEVTTLGISYLAISVEYNKGEGNFYFNFASKCRKTKVEDILTKELNAKGFRVDTFDNDAGVGASNAVRNILEKKHKSGYYVREYGEQPADIARRLKQERQSNDMLSEEEIDEKTFQALSQSIEKCGSQMDDVQKRMEGVDIKLSDFSENLSELNQNLKRELESKKDVIAKLSRELEARNNELSARNKELSDRKKSQKITFDNLERAELECARLRQENNRLYAEMSATNPLMLIRDQLKEDREIQDRRFKAMMLQNNLRFKVLCDALGLKAEGTESMDI